jgi:RNA polymerase sigma-70 factor (ECF subfamily)
MMTHTDRRNRNKRKIIKQREETLRDQIVGLLPRLRRFGLSLTKELDSADDIVQGACERALTRLDQLRDGSRLDSWLCRIIYTQWIDTLRRRQVRSEKLIVLSRETDSRSASSVADPNFTTSLDVRTALESLPEEHRAAVMLVCVEGYGYAEAADVLNVPAGTIASRVSRAREMMSRRLRGDKGQVLRLTKMEGKNDSAV